MLENIAEDVLKKEKKRQKEKERKEEKTRKNEKLKKEKKFELEKRRLYLEMQKGKNKFNWWAIQVLLIPLDDNSFKIELQKVTLKFNSKTDNKRLFPELF